MAQAGVYKICGCRDKVKCRHPWWFSFKRRGSSTRFRKSLDLVLEKHVDSKTSAEQEAGRLRAGILATLDNPAALALSLREREVIGLEAPPSVVSVLSTLTVGQMLKTYLDRHLVTTATHDKQAYQIKAIGRTVLKRADDTDLPFSDWLIVDVTTDTVERLREARRVQTIHKRAKGSNKSGGTTAANRDLQLLRAAFKWSIRNKLVKTENPFTYQHETVVKLHRELARSRRLQLGTNDQPGEAERLLNACSPHLRAIVEAALETGCRLGELLSLTWQQIERGHRPELHLPAGKTKTGKPRRVPISSRLLAILDMRETALRTELELDEKERTPEGLYVFGNEIGERIGSIKTAWHTAVTKAKIEDLHFHDLRREAGSRWLDSRQVTLVTIQKWLGHSNIKQTSTYLQTTTHGEHEAMRMFETAVGRLTPIDTEGGTPPHEQAPQDTASAANPQQNTVRH